MSRLAYSNSSALRSAADHRDRLETVTGSHGLSIPAGRNWRRDLQLIDLQGLILLVNGCTKPACVPFKQWCAEVIETVQREGSYTLEEAEVQPADPGAPIAYAMPQQVADAIVRLEERNLQADEQLVVTQHESLALQRTMLDMQQTMIEVQRESLAARTGLSVHRVNECLRMLRKHACIHSRGGSEDGAPVYVLNRP
ncbi:Bro-N domain-containing protein [Streptomyces sp. NPDC002742]|uniref:BRO-N domain-containing protein n=1 Tax=Streptomyces sp. NPDC002742 TaxID=3364663 RepID=UPI0036A56F7C